MSEEEHRLKTGSRAPSLAATLILGTLIGVGTILTGIAAMWLILR
jgi:hypothetical protein